MCTDVIRNVLHNFCELITPIGLSISPSKTKLCVISRKYKLPLISININNCDIEVVQCIKFLGMWIDSRFKWTKHINELTQKCIPFINILSCVSGLSFGIHPTHLRRLYISTVRSRLDYGCFLFGNASPRLLQKLDVIQNQCLRICGGFIRSTPTHVMQTEMCIPPLFIRRNYLSHKYFLKISSRQNDYCHERLAVFENLIKSNVPYWRKNQLPLLQSSHRQYQDLNIYKFQNWPSHQLPFIIYKIDLTSIIKIDIKNITSSKAKLSIKELKDATVSMIQVNYADFVQIYTDGSKTGNHNGCSFYDPVALVAAKFNVDDPNVNIMCLELLAIAEALHYLTSTNYTKIVIFTDSKSSLYHLLACNRGKLGRKEAYLIIESIQTMIRNGINVYLQWVPSHVGVFGNEVADELAKVAQSDGIPLRVSLQSSDYIPIVKKLCYDQWKTHYNVISCEKGIWYKSLTAEPPQIPWFSNTRMTYKELVACFRLRSGHVPLNNFGYLMSKTESPNCVVCNTKEDLMHLLIECKINESLRIKLLTDTQCPRQDIMFLFHSVLSSKFASNNSKHIIWFYIHSLELRKQLISV
ncbi:unnamed protein product, partial [Brenthis ino]